MHVRLSYLCMPNLAKRCNRMKKGDIEARYTQEGAHMAVLRSVGISQKLQVLSMHVRDLLWVKTCLRLIQLKGARELISTMLLKAWTLFAKSAASHYPKDNKSTPDSKQVAYSCAMQSQTRSMNISPAN